MDILKNVEEVDSDHNIQEKQKDIQISFPSILKINEKNEDNDDEDQNSNNQSQNRKKIRHQTTLDLNCFEENNNNNNETQDEKRKENINDNNEEDSFQMNFNNENYRKNINNNDLFQSENSDASSNLCIQKMKQQSIRDRMNSMKSDTQIHEDSSSCSPIRLMGRERAKTRRASIRSELKLSLCGINTTNTQQISSQLIQLAAQKVKKQVEIFSTKYEQMSKIAEGGNAVVKRCKKIGDEKINYIVKIMKFKETEEVFRQQEEFNIAIKLNHPNIVKTIDFIVEKSFNKAYIVQEYVKGDSLTNLLAKKKKIPENQAQFIIQQSLTGLNYLHKNQICHRDLHCGNIIYNKKTKIVKIIDFSISKQLKQQKIKMMTQSGIVYFMAPEQLEGGNFYDKKVDIWALGVVFFTLLTGYYPFQNKEDNEEQVIQSILKEEPLFENQDENNISKEAKDLLFKMLEKDPVKRINVKQALQHPWFLQNKNSIFLMKMGYSEKQQQQKEKKNSIQSIISNATNSTSTQKHQQQQKNKQNTNININLNSNIDSRSDLDFQVNGTADSTPPNNNNKLKQKQKCFCSDTNNSNKIENNKQQQQDCKTCDSQKVENDIIIIQQTDKKQQQLCQSNTDIEQQNKIQIKMQKQQKCKKSNLFNSTSSNKLNSDHKIPYCDIEAQYKKENNNYNVNNQTFQNLQLVEEGSNHNSYKSYFLSMENLDLK